MIDRLPGINPIHNAFLCAVANNAYSDYKKAIEKGAVEPESFVEEWMKAHFTRISTTATQVVWIHFLLQLIDNKRKKSNE